MAEDKKEEEDLKKEVKKLNKRIVELEELISEIQEPFRQLQKAAKSYYRFIDLYLRHGEVSPEIMVPDLKDPISKEILIVLFEKNGLNISKITEAVRNKRGSASRRIIREKLGRLEEKGYVTTRQTRKSTEYYLSEELVKKWSEVLGFSK